MKVVVLRVEQDTGGTFVPASPAENSDFSAEVSA